MTEQERIELNISLIELQAALIGIRNHNASCRREREMVGAGFVSSLGQGIARIETLLMRPVEPPPRKEYKRMKG